MYVFTRVRVYLSLALSHILNKYLYLDSSVKLLFSWICHHKCFHKYRQSYQNVYIT